MDKLKQLLDMKTTWATIGILTGTIFGEQAATAMNAFGAFVMVLL